jgi:tRNA threonylcarbamoyladenosine biosynthesis protein TsaB
MQTPGRRSLEDEILHGMGNLLALDTSTPRAAVALATAGGGVYVAQPDPQARHGRNLVPCVQALLRQAGLAIGAIDLFAVGLGPGSYTGLRVGLTAAKVLAYAAGRPLVGFDSLEAVARNAPGDALSVAVVADAQRGEVYSAEFGRAAPGGPLARRTATRVEPLTGWVDRLAAGTFVLGPGLELERLRQALPDHVAAVRPGDAANWPDPHRLPPLARELWHAGRRDDLWFLEPLYLRRSAAEDQWDRKGAIPGARP